MGDLVEHDKGLHYCTGRFNSTMARSRKSPGCESNLKLPLTVSVTVIVREGGRSSIP
jgi:hypothetical protein